MVISSDFYLFNRIVNERYEKGLCCDFKGQNKQCEIDLFSL
jgi:tRNA(Glu) U13 pseudouridine synthase TruD